MICRLCAVVFIEYECFPFFPNRAEHQLLSPDIQTEPSSSRPDERKSRAAATRSCRGVFLLGNVSERGIASPGGREKEVIPPNRLKAERSIRAWITDKYTRRPDARLPQTEQTQTSQQEMEISKHATEQTLHNADAEVEKNTHKGLAVPRGPHDIPLMVEPRAQSSLLLKRKSLRKEESLAVTTPDR